MAISFLVEVVITPEILRSGLGDPSQDPKISQQHNIDLLIRVSDEEVKKALFQMYPDKSPGPDGMTQYFYQKCWNIVGNDVIQLVKNFFLSGMLLDGLNNTNIVLISKKKCPVNMRNLRPISPRNVLYKVISKVLANRLKVVLPLVISDTQSVFIPGRLISDNIMVSFEVKHYLKKKKQRKEGFMVIKFDLSKAYDRIEWGFPSCYDVKDGF